MIFIADTRQKGGYIKFTSKREAIEAWDSLTTEQKEGLKKVYAKVLEALKEGGGSPMDISVSKTFDEYIERCRWESEILLMRASCKSSKIK